MNQLISKSVSYLSGMINQGQERSVKAKKNILASFLIKGLSIGISLILVPLTIHYVNPTQYGIWITLSSIIAWFGFFDIGFGHGLRNKFAEAMALGNHQQAKMYVSTTYTILSIIVAVVLLLFFCIHPFLNWSAILNTPASMAAELSILALLVFVFFCIQFVLQLITTMITANQEPAKASFIYLLSSLFSLVLIYILTRTTNGNLIYLGLVLGLSPIVVLGLSTLWFFTHQFRRYAPSLSAVQWSCARDLMDLGVRFFVLQIAGVVLYQTSNIIIAQLFGPTQVTPYNIAFKYFSIIPMAMGIVMSPFWSAYTDAWFKQDIQWIKRSISKLQLIWGFFAIVTLIMLFFSNFVYRLWVGEEIEVPISVSIVLAVYVITNGWTSIYTMFLNGTGKISLQLYASLVGMVFNIPLAIFLGQKIGIAGVILSTLVLSGINMVLEPIQSYKLINRTAVGVWNK